MVTLRSIFPLGLGVTAFLAIALALLKLNHVVEWSWWWVSAPIWGIQALFATSLAVAAMVGLLVGLFSPTTGGRHGV